MPTLLACTVASVALVVAVGLQAPAVSVGMRWEPLARSGRRRIEPLEGLGLEFGGLAQPGPGWLSWVGWIVAAFVAYWIVRWVLRWIQRVTRPTPSVTLAGAGRDSGAPGEPNAQIMQFGLAAALQILRSERDSGDAVVRAWQGLEDAAAAAGLDRRPAETPSEFTARILYRSRNSRKPIDLLLSLYQRVRFGSHSPDEAEIAAARDSLATLVELWQNDLPEQRPARARRR